MIRKTLLHLIIVMILIVLVGACRKQWTATEMDMANYGWTLFESGSYLESYEWFLNSIKEDSTYQDGYNGLGWALGKLQQPANSVTYFRQGLDLEPDPVIATNVPREIIAGLCFIENAIGKDSLAIQWGDSLLARLSAELEGGRWVFSHDTTINHLDVRVTVAMSNYSVGNFETSLTHVQTILAEINPTAPVWTTDVNTVEGRQTLASKIEELQVFLATP
jgi:tetratricopeptide (TPR) repeat protein